MSAVSPERRAKLGLVHQLAKANGLDDSAYRGKLQLVTGKTSARDCTDAELDRFVASFHVKRKANNSYTAKAKALWIAAWNIGALQSGDDRALDAFVKRQTGKDALAFLTPGEANSVSEALKEILKRAGCDVPAGDEGGLRGRVNLVRAQWLILEQRGLVRAPGIFGLDAFALKIVGGAYRGVTQMTARDLDRVAVVLGRKVRMRP